MRSARSSATPLPQSYGSIVLNEPQPAKLPARVRIKEIAIACARMPGRGGVRAAAQYHLADHELAVVLPERALRCAVARIGQIGAAGPLPDHAEGIVEEIGARLPLRLGGKMLAGPAGEGVGLVVAHVHDR